MSNVSIFEKKWLDLVFEGKNQEYGAYQLRRESSKTTLFALLFGSSVLLGGTFLLSSFNNAPADEEVIINCPIAPVSPTIFKPENEKPKTEQPRKNEQPEDVKKNVPLVVARTPEAQPDVPRTTPASTPTTTPSTGGGGTGTPTDTPSTGGGGTIIPSKPFENVLVKTSELDHQPNFPGGMKGFYDYVSENFEKQNIEEGSIIRVFVSFVIEKNGAMTDIKVLRNTDPDIDKEAVRVLKSLKTKWTPGIKDGEAVRTQYVLPISVKA